MNLSREFLGSLYQGDQATKGWNAIGNGHLHLRIVPCSKSKKWKLEANKDKQKVWECFVDDSFTFKLRDNFVQWSLTNNSKQKSTYGFRIKELNSAQELVDLLGYITSNPLATDRQLNITLPSKQQISLYFKKSLTMAGVLKQVSTQHSLETAAYALARATHSGLTPLKPQTTVSDLETPDVVFVKRHRTTSEAIERTATKETVKPPSPAEENTILLTVVLPNENAVKIKVKHDITLLELLKLICLQNGLNPSAHQFDLPIANQDKIKLKQLKISSITLIRKEGIIGDEVEGTDGGGASNTLKTKLRVAPPPPKSPISRPQLHSSPSSSPSSKRGIESTDNGGSTNPNSTEDVNDFISRMLSQQAIGKPSPLTHSPSRDSTRRKLNPAPPPPSSHSKLTSFPSPSHSKSGSVKRAAPPPPSLIKDSATVSKHRGTEHVDGHSGDKKHFQGAVALPCMTKLTKNPGILQSTTQSNSNSDESSNVTPTLSRSIQPPYSPGKKPARKAPIKPPSKGSGVTPPLTTALSSHSQSDTTNNDSHSLIESKPVASTVSTSAPMEGPFQFKFPPPPPKPLSKEKDVVDEALHVKDDSSDISSNADSDNESDSTEQSSTNDGYDVESEGGEHEDTTNTPSDSDEEDENTTEDDTSTTRNENESMNEEQHDFPETRDKHGTQNLSRSESESADSSDDEEGDEGIMLISHVKTERTPVQPVADSEPEDTEKLKKLDDKIMSLRSLIADTCELGGGSSTDLTKKQDSIDSDFDLSSISNMAPPPEQRQSSNGQPLLPEAPKAPPPPPIGGSSSPLKQPPPPAPKPKPPPPAVKPKPLNKPSMEDELAMKLQRRQLKMNEPDPVNTVPSFTPQSQGDVTMGGVTSMGLKASGNTTPSNSTTFGGGANVLGSTPSGTIGGGGPEMQVQLQMLQQQMMQQQMMQLQQQFQQLQSMVAGNPSQSASFQLQQQMQQLQQLQLLQQQQHVTPGTVLGPSTTSLIMPPGVPAPVMGNQPSLSMPPNPQFSMLPQQQLYGVNPSLMAANQVPQQFQMPQQQQVFQPMMGIPQPTSGSLIPPSISPTQSPPPTNVLPPTLLPVSVIHVADIAPTETFTEPKPAKSLSRKPSEADVRMKAMGTATDNFDNLMDEVRETNPTQILKKVSVTEKEQSSSTVYSGMTAALVEAMKERRKSFQDSDGKRESIGQDWDEDQEQN